MRQDSELHIVIPGICGPLAETQSLKSNAVFNQWLRTLSRSTCSASTGNAHSVLAALSGLTIEGDFPTAAYTLLVNNLYQNDISYMCADPVHLQADMDHAVLTSSMDLNISTAESSALCASLNLHFEQDGLKFLLLNKDQWIVSSKEKIHMQTTPLSEATGRNVNFILPEGKDAMHWKQILTEAQMLLHAHEINAAREEMGRSTINSLWFHGSGELCSGELNLQGMCHSSEKVMTFCSDDDLLKGMAVSTQCDYKKIPEAVDGYIDYLSRNESGSVNILHMAQIEHLVNYSDVRPWLSQLSDTVERWVYPLIDFSNKNNIKVTLYPCNENKYQFSKYDSLKFWRKDKLEQHVSSY